MAEKEQRKVIAIYGGSFNPPLNSHFSIAQEVLNQFEEVEKIVFMPVNKSYRKSGLIDNNYRYNMLKIIADKNEKFMVSDLDMNGKESLKTIDILKKVQIIFPDDEIWFVMGSDNLRDLPNWEKPETILSKFKVIVMERDGDNLEEIIESNELLKTHKQNIKILSQEIKSNFNSTYVREQIKKGKSIRYLLPDEICEYIEKNKLYKGDNL